MTGTRFSLTDVENIPLNFQQRALLVELVREEINQIETGYTSYGRSDQNEDSLDELNELIELLNTPR